jgi:hypothetical protein
MAIAETENVENKQWSADGDRTVVPGVDVVEILSIE